MQQALFGGGCFWCVEAVYLELQGIHKVTSGYAGGDTDNPTYEDICRGDTNHAEVILIDFDETQISYAQLLDVFFSTNKYVSLWPVLYIHSHAYSVNLQPQYKAT